MRSACILPPSPVLVPALALKISSRSSCPNSLGGSRLSSIKDVPFLWRNEAVSISDIFHLLIPSLTYSRQDVVHHLCHLKASVKCQSLAPPFWLKNNRMTSRAPLHACPATWTWMSQWPHIGNTHELIRTSTKFLEIIKINIYENRYLYITNIFRVQLLLRNLNITMKHENETSLIGPACSTRRSSLPLFPVTQPHKGSFWHHK